MAKEQQRCGLHETAAAATLKRPVQFAYSLPTRATWVFSCLSGPRSTMTTLWHVAMFEDGRRRCGMIFLPLD